VIRVLVASASSVVRAGLESMIERSSSLTVVGSAPGPATSVFARRIEELRPDVVLIELDRTDDSAWNELLGLASRSPVPAIVVLADHMQGTPAVEALRAGVRALLAREAVAEEIEAAIHAAASGLVVLEDVIAESLAGRVAVVPRGESETPAEALTAREIEALTMIAEGLGNKSIAQRMGISEHTVKFHLSSIFAKLGVASRTEAVKVGIRRGLIMV
jgi:two-component system, NarL family, response regulator YdfI